eukprot:3747481-Rhodomonas_salina.2
MSIGADSTRAGTCLVAALPMSAPHFRPRMWTTAWMLPATEEDQEACEAHCYPHLLFSCLIKTPTGSIVGWWHPPACTICWMSTGHFEVVASTDRTAHLAACGP